MSNTLWFFICLLIGVIIALVCDLVASSICSREEDSKKNSLVSKRFLAYGWVLICVSLAFNLRCISIINKQNKEKIEQLTEQIDSLKTLHGSGLDAVKEE